MADIKPFIALKDIPFIICPGCQCVVMPSEAYTHLQRHHKIDPKRRRAIEAEVNKLPNIIHNREELERWVAPAATNDAVPELKPPANSGFACDECRYIVETINAI